MNERFHNFKESVAVAGVMYQLDKAVGHFTNGPSNLFTLYELILFYKADNANFSGTSAALLSQLSEFFTDERWDAYHQAKKQGLATANPTSCEKTTLTVNDIVEFSKAVFSPSSKLVINLVPVEVEAKRGLSGVKAKRATKSSSLCEGLKDIVLLMQHLGNDSHILSDSFAIVPEQIKNTEMRDLSNH